MTQVDTVPTIGFNVETVTLVKNVSFLVWDVTGQEKVRPLWKHYTSGADGIMFVVDSCDRLVSVSCLGYFNFISKIEVRRSEARARLSFRRPRVEECAAGDSSEQARL